jgi:peptide chain release factor 2
MTHRQSGIVVECQKERWQAANKDTEMNMLKGKLMEQEERRRQEEIAKEKGDAQDVGWGSQIRSYVLHPYTMVKDHRTNVEVGNAQGVLDGDLDEFVRAELLRRAGNGAAAA